MAETRTSSVLDQSGRPFKVSTLAQEQATPTRTGVRSPWAESIAGGLDPARLAQILKAAAEGDAHDYLTLAEEMEERDTHYASVLGQRKRAVSGIEPVVTAGDASTEVADAVENLIASPRFADMVDEALDGLAKGYSAIEMVWDTGADRWTPAKYLHRDPRHFQFDKASGQELRVRDDDHEDGLELRPYGWIVHKPRLKSGLPVRGGLARLVAWCFMLKSYTLQDWAAFLEVFGMPLRLGKFGDGASAEEKRILLRAVRDLATDAAAIIPKGMDIEFIEASGGQGNSVFGAMADYLDKQISKAVIGQTMTTDEGSSRAQSEVHDEVRGDITRADARQMATTINRDLIVPFVGLNWGWDVPVPVVSFPADDADDIEAMTKALSALVPLGVRIASADVNKRMGFRLPDEGEEVLRPAAVSPEPPASQTAAQACPGCGETHRASAQNSDDDELVAEAMDEWDAAMEPIVAQVLAASKAATSFEEFSALLDELSPDTSALAERLAIQMMKARGEGAADG